MGIDPETTAVAGQAPSSLASLRFDNHFVRELPGDPEARNFRRQVVRACYSRVQPTPVAAPRLLALSDALATELGLSPQAIRDDAEGFAAVFAGNRLVPGMEPYAACYGGHQFGNWAGQLGDGRAITLGEAVIGEGRRLELQLKGAGPTPYSRGADGRAVLRSSLREFLCSEAMHHLGVPTTRALSLVTTGEPVMRDMFYDGRPALEPGAVVCRVAPSFLRFGNFELFASRGDHETLAALCEYMLREHFAELSATAQSFGDHLVAAFTEICRRTAVMVDHWMRVGFVHGVMNTDNMSILGLTIDYGPYGWLEPYDPMWTPNTTDLPGRRYAFGRQPVIAQWNLVQLARALAPLVGAVEPLAEALEVYVATLSQALRTTMASKLGLQALRPSDQALVEDLWPMLQVVETDMTLFFRALAQVTVDAEAVAVMDDHTLLEPLAEAFYASPDDAAAARIAGWLRRYVARAAEDARPVEQRAAQMNAVNPRYVPRNYLAQLAIDAAAEGDASELEALLDTLRRPYDDQPGRERFAAKRPEWARQRAGCSMLSCSS